MSEDPAAVQRREKAAARERVSAAAIKLKAWERIFLVTKIEEHIAQNVTTRKLLGMSVEVEKPYLTEHALLPPVASSCA